MTVKFEIEGRYFKSVVSFNEDENCYYMQQVKYNGLPITDQFKLNFLEVVTLKNFYDLMKELC